ncbi:FitA-like ribbon-helix-helix domain-containing protein [Antarcticirhabdus aurantiaca]|uniref:Stabilization protein n=1 Tax=Antarcticirhabdus aurantiaca TaxID=2606717 RepID=A0ACD4NP99_9HYPH|nr:plasmid stabilization protein [Antarcticirhabdus aurantiaca]WAJ28597.1 stabilization protein [Jeongeuplla avenae]
MAQVTVRRLDDAVLDKLKARAKANDRSTEAEIREILRAAADGPVPGQRKRSLRELMGSAPSDRTVEEIVADIRALRDEWEDRG